MVEIGDLLGEPELSTSVIDLNDADLAGTLSVTEGDGEIINGDAITSTGVVLLGRNSLSLPFDGFVEFDSIASGGQLTVGNEVASAFTGYIEIAGDCDGTIEVYDITYQGTVGAIEIGGDLDGTVICRSTDAGGVYIDVA